MTQPSRNTHTVMTWIVALMAIDALSYRNWVCKSFRRWIGMGDTSASGGLPKPPKTFVNNWSHAEHERAGRTSPCVTPADLSGWRDPSPDPAVLALPWSCVPGPWCNVAGHDNLASCLGILRPVEIARGYAVATKRDLRTDEVRPSASTTLERARQWPGTVRIDPRPRVAAPPLSTKPVLAPAPSGPSKPWLPPVRRRVPLWTAA
jgi:hypothetical protein